MKISSAHARWFRFRRSGLEEPFATAAETARHLIGVQAQLPAASDLSLFNRTVGMSQDSLAEARLEERSILRMWGQRNTVHIYAADDWPLLYRIFSDRKSVMEGRLEEAGLLDTFQRLVKQLKKRLARGKPLTYKDVRSCNGFETLQAAQDGWPDVAAAPGDASWVICYAAFFRLVRDGIVCHGPDQGSESTFVHRQHWLPDLDWSSADEEGVYADVACRYLRAYGPATHQDMAAWFGTTATNAKQWMAAAGERVMAVEVDGRSCKLCTEDAEVIDVKPPASGKWPVRLLYRFDPYVLSAVGSKHKDWLIDADHFKKVWRPGAHIEAVVVVGGRIVGTWRYDRKSKGLVIRVFPFDSLSQTVNRAVERKARAIAAFMDLELLEVRIEG